MFQCAKYDEGKLEGNLCKVICTDKDIRYRSCTNYREGKKILIADWGEITVILKSKRATWDEYELIGININNDYIPHEREFAKIVADSMKFNLNIPVLENTDILSNMWFMDFKQISVNYESQKAATQSLWSLIQQDEYVLFKVLQSNKYIPHIYGTCGHFYVLEYLPPGRLLESSFSQLTRFAHSPWKDHVILAVFILELLKSFEEDFHEILHICDLKGENFGLDSDGSVKILDVDMVFFHSKLQSFFSDRPPGDLCHKDADCHFFDCESHCDVHTGSCLPDRTNNNLQVSVYIISIRLW